MKYTVYDPADVTVITVISREANAAVIQMMGSVMIVGQESKSAERYVRQGNVLLMATRTKISEKVFNERPVSIF